MKVFEKVKTPKQMAMLEVILRDAPPKFERYLGDIDGLSAVQANLWADMRRWIAEGS